MPIVFVFKDIERGITLSMDRKREKFAHTHKFHVVDVSSHIVVNSRRHQYIRT